MRSGKIIVDFLQLHNSLSPSLTNISNTVYYIPILVRFFNFFYHGHPGSFSLKGLKIDEEGTMCDKLNRTSITILGTDSISSGSCRSY